MKIKEAAELADVTPRTVRRWIKTGDLPARKVARGNRDVWEIEPADLAAFAESTGRTLKSADSTDGQPVTSEDAESRTKPEKDPDNAPDTRQLQAKVADLERQLADTKSRLRAVQQERDFLRETVRNLTTKALPAAGDRRGLLARIGDFFTGRDEEDD